MKQEIKIAFIGGGSQIWASTIIRDLIFKPGLDQVNLNLALLDTDRPRAQAVHELFEVKLREWEVNWAKTSPTDNPEQALEGADFVIIAISTGRLPAMKHDLEIPDKYGIYHTVGDTCGPGGWARALRNIPVFADYARQIKRLAPEAYVLNYTNPMGTLTKVLAEELGYPKVVGLCHSLFENYHILMAIFGLEREDQIKSRCGGLNHFFWMLDLEIDGQEGYHLLEEKLQGRNFATLLDAAHRDSLGFGSQQWLAGELYRKYGYLPYVGDRHTCEFFDCYITDKAEMERLQLVRTSVGDREQMYAEAAERIGKWTRGEEADFPLDRQPSRETAADIIKAITFDQGFEDVVNMVNTGQISNLPAGAVVETKGHIDRNGATALKLGALPENLVPLVAPHAQVQLQTVEAGLSGDLDKALAALAADPLCARLSPDEIRKMGLELLTANRQYLPQFFKA
jgi:alpha-galactosidase/6-phospho-beta-glucosidase family protein